MTLQEYQSRVHYIATLIRIVANENIQCICECVETLQGDGCDIEELDENTIYETYCNCNSNREEEKKW